MTQYYLRLTNVFTVSSSVCHNQKPPSALLAWNLEWSPVRAPASPLNIRLGWKWPTVTNTLAYYDTVLFTTYKCVHRKLECLSQSEISFCSTSMESKVESCNGSSLAFKYQTRMEVTASDKHSSLIWHSIIYDLQMCSQYARVFVTIRNLLLLY